MLTGSSSGQSVFVYDTGFVQRDRFFVGKTGAVSSQGIAVIGDRILITQDPASLLQSNGYWFYAKDTEIPSVCNSGSCIFNYTKQVMDFTAPETSPNGNGRNLILKFNVTDLCLEKPTSIDSANLSLFMVGRNGIPINNITIEYITNQWLEENVSSTNINSFSYINLTGSPQINFTGFVPNQYNNVSVLEQLRVACQRNETLSLRIMYPREPYTTFTTPTLNSSMQLGDATNTSSSSEYAIFASREWNQQDVVPKNPFITVKYTPATAAISVVNAAPFNNTYLNSVGYENLTCNFSITSGTVDYIQYNVIKYYGGWGVYKTYNQTNITTSAASGQANFTINLTNGWYQWNCQAFGNGVNASSQPTRFQRGKGEIYVVRHVHTEPDINSTMLQIFQNNLNNNTGNPMDDFRVQAGYRIYDSMLPSHRYAYNDSYGRQIKYDWDLRMDEMECNSLQGCSVVIDNFRFYYGNATTWEDFIGYHSHLMDWYNYSQFDPDSDGFVGDKCPAGGCQPANYWNQVLTFNATTYRNDTEPQLLARTMARFLIDSNLYPTSQVSGWLWENTNFSNYVDNFLPFSYNNRYGQTSFGGYTQPIENYFTWTSTKNYSYYPSNSNYELIGNNSRIQVPCWEGGGAFHYTYTEAYNLTQNGTDVIYCTYSHSYSDLIGDTQAVAKCLNSTKYGACALGTGMDVLYPNTKYNFLNDLKSWQEIFETTDTTPPQISVVVGNGVANVSSNEALWNEPIIAVKNSTDYYLVFTTQIGTNLWQANISAYNAESVRAAGVDIAYNSNFSAIFVSVLTITNPTTLNPKTVTTGENVTMNFTVTNSSGTALTSDVTVLNITLTNSSGTLNITNRTTATYNAGNWQINGTMPYLSSGSYTLTITANHSSTGVLSGSQADAIVVSGANIISFSVYTLFTGNFTNSNLTFNYTEAYYFNATTMYQEWINPCANANAITNCQNGANRPAFSILNTGTVPISIHLKLSNSMAGTGITMCANSTGEATVTGTIAICTQGNLNETSWNKLAIIPTTKRANVTIYGNFSYTQGGIYSNLNTINSTE
jgi:hypothetical protein